MAGTCQVECGDAEAARRIEERIGVFAAWAQRNPGKRGRLLLSFYEKRQRQSWFRCAAPALGVSRHVGAPRDCLWLRSNGSS